MSVKLRKQTVAVVSGDTVELQIDVIDDGDVAVSLTGATAVFKAARRQTDTVFVLDSTASPGPSAVVGPNDDSPSIDQRVTVTIPKSLTAPLRGRFYFECEVTDIAGARQTVALGYLVFEPDLIT